MLRHARIAFRALRRNPGLACVCIITLAIGIGANTAIFSVVNALLLRPFPYRNAEQLAVLWESDPGHGFPQETPSTGNFQQWRAQNHTFSHMAAVSNPNFSLLGRGEPERVAGCFVTADFFPMLGVQPISGRTLDEHDDQPGAPGAVVLSYRLWKRKFDGAPDVVGRTVRLNNRPYTIAGVMPPAFTFPYPETQLWVAFRLTPERLNDFGMHFLNVFARLKDGATLQQAQRDLDVIAARLRRDHPVDNAGIGVDVTPLREMYVSDVRRALLVLFGAVALVLLIACANVANLLLARSSGRRRELAIRAALGASRAEIMLQLLTESFGLGVAGGMAGLLAGWWALAALMRFAPAELLAGGSAGIDFRVLAFTAGISLFTSVLFGMAPAFRASRVSVQSALKDGGKASAGLERSRTRSALVISELALALILLIGAGLMVQSLLRMRGVDPGFRPDHLLTLRVALSSSRYADHAQVVAFLDRILARIDALPGVESAAAVSHLPTTVQGDSNAVTVEGRPLAPGAEPVAYSRVVTADYFTAMRMRRLAGRLFDARDGSNSPPVCAINETMAKRLWPNEDPVGKRIKMGDSSSKDVWIRVVGVVNDVLENAPGEPVWSEMYFPYRQGARWSNPREIVVRTATDPISLAGAVRAQIRDVDPDEPTYDVRTMEEILDSTVSRPRFQAWLIGAFAAIALVLCAVGIYGVISYVVAQRIPEIGIRMALGASRPEVLWMVVRQTGALALSGITLGCAGAAASSRALRSLLYGVAPLDPATYAVFALLLFAVALLAGWIPARRATRVDPLVALRYE